MDEKPDSPPSSPELIDRKQLAVTLECAKTTCSMCVYFLEQLSRSIHGYKSPQQLPSTLAYAQALLREVEGSEPSTRLPIWEVAANHASMSGLHSRRDIDALAGQYIRRDDVAGPLLGDSMHILAKLSIEEMRKQGWHAMPSPIQEISASEHESFAAALEKQCTQMHIEVCHAVAAVHFALLRRLTVLFASLQQAVTQPVEQASAPGSSPQERIDSLVMRARSMLSHVKFKLTENEELFVISLPLLLGAMYFEEWRIKPEPMLPSEFLDQQEPEQSEGMLQRDKPKVIRAVDTADIYRKSIEGRDLKVVKIDIVMTENGIE